MNNNSGDGTILNTLINKIQSVECRKYLESNIDSISLLQWCTIIIEASISKDERMELFNSLLNLAKSSYESKLITMAISDLKRYGYVSNRVDNYYNRHDPRLVKNEFVFNEYIGFPIIFKKGDVVCLKDNEAIHYLVIGALPSIYDAEKPEFGDSTYLAYELVPFSNLFDIHYHLHAIELNAWKYENLSESEKDIYDKIIKIIKDDNYLNK